MTEVQQVILSIYKEVAELCKRHDITYYAIGGTCLGAVRHKGFIPWDDDLDIAIPIERFDQFLAIARKELPDYLYVFSPFEIKSYSRPFYKICDSRTTFVESAHKLKKDAYKGVYIDIMPISGIPDESRRKDSFCSKVEHLLENNNRIRLQMVGDTYKSRLFSFVKKIFAHIIPSNYYITKYYKYISNYPFANSELTGYVWSSKIRRWIFPSSFFGDGIELPFEDTKINCPIKCHEYLSAQFGNYLQLPPIEERRNHNPYILDLQKSYKDYINQN